MSLALVPGRGLLRLLLAWVALAVAAAAAPWTYGVWQGAAGLVALLTVAALVQVARPPAVTVERTLASTLALGEWVDVKLLFRNPGKRPLAVEVFDHYPTSAELEGLPATLTLPAASELERTYRLRPRRRGDQRFGAVEIWRRSFFDLLRRRSWAGAGQTVRVLPNFRPILIQGLAGLEHRLADLGMHLQRRRGEGLEFQELRDYREGDGLRKVDWKATARRGKLISRQYQEERNQQVILMLDCGRRMHAREGELTHFDHVLNAALLLAYVAVRQGDAIGVQAFSGQDRWLPPVRGLAAVHRVLEALHDLQTSTVSPDYSEAAARLMERQSRRALVLLLTNLRDEDSSELLNAVQVLRRRHLVLVASTRELALRRLREQPVQDHESALAVTAVHRYLSARHRAHAAVRHAGALLLDVEPPELPPALVARYLEIKRAGQL